jgi:predicted GTPase
MSLDRVIIMGAAGRDFHNFNIYFRDNSNYNVVAFTATQIPNIEGRVYPPELAGDLYPEGIPIYPEDQLPKLIQEQEIDQVIFSYSDVSHQYVMHRASQVLVAGADFRLLGLNATTLMSQKPVISVCAARTGSGKSQTTRRVSSILGELGYTVAAVRHPMPYGDLVAQAQQRFGSYQDLEAANCTIEEREEYEPLLALGVVVYSGVDYEAILRQAEQEADILLWDGGNNDLPFFKSDLHIVVVDPLRPGHEVMYHPGEANVIAADVIIINKVDSASAQGIYQVRENVKSLNPEALILEAASPISVDDSKTIRGKRVLVVEDGPTLTHGDMAYGAGYVAAKRFGAAEIVDPRPFSNGSIAEIFKEYPNTGKVLPAMGYGRDQMRELEDTINRSDADLVLIGTPIDLGRLLNLNIPSQRVRYELQETGKPTLRDLLSEKFGKKQPR